MCVISTPLVPKFAIGPPVILPLLGRAVSTIHVLVTKTLAAVAYLPCARKKEKQRPQPSSTLSPSLFPAGNPANSGLRLNVGSSQQVVMLTSCAHAEPVRCTVFLAASAYESDHGSPWWGGTMCPSRSTMWPCHCAVDG
ncbi:uncharacterized protein SETTUDRAFT_33481 [Exserohilum turcica Et28A]|uniref:Uncharacterized protein n=1 Tax=Exserohilum turcicum (strain 28A) TaxID=671987 RepID=R0ICU2_EXST2|nr:uncharacterized protein SETTUDRAFT_33481 [Exserohilum turcica Et28A]EOA83165.1 hypothetical protein SETTUDRAFT_33481 [Exserohilum turcica Et28A]